MSVIVALRYVLTSGFFAWLSQRLYARHHDGQGQQISREIKWSLLSASIYGIPAGIVAWGWNSHGWTQIYSDVSDYPLWYVPVSLGLYLCLHDSWFYWTHRLFHRPEWFRVAHAVHHESRPPTAWAAMSFHPIEAISGAIIIPLLVFVVPIHLYMLGLVLFIMTFMGVTNHMGWDIFPRFIVQGWLGKFLITASHHQKHHTDYRGNYGLYFRFWDQVCGTDCGLGHFDHDGGRRRS